MPKPASSQEHVYRGLVYLQALSAWNRLLTRLRRLRQPKYLFGALVGVFYFYAFFFRSLLGGRNGLSGPRPTLPAEFATLGESVGALVLLVVVLLAWLMPRRRTALAFSEAEVAFLFPAPVSRRTLINFKLLKSQSSILFTALVFSVLSTRFGRFGHIWLHAAGWWLVLATLNLHFLGASFAVTRLMDKGITPHRRRWAIFLGAALTTTLILVWAHGSVPEPTPDDFGSVASLARYFRQFFEAGPLPPLLYPFRLLIRPYLAGNAAEFLLALVPALGLLALHYLWVIRAEVAFEEASLELSRRRAEIVTAAREGRDWTAAQPPRKGRRAPFRLAPVGPPTTALLWKNLIAAGRMFNLRILIVVGASMVLFVTASTAGTHSAHGGWSLVLGMLTITAFLWFFLIGPQIFRQDLRHDLPLADVLKQCPLCGWQVVLGEMLAPAVILTVIQWSLLVVAACFFTTLPGQQAAASVLDRAAVALSAALLVPALNLVLLLLPNAAVLLWPSWMLAARSGQGGIEIIGQRIILLIGQLLVFAVALVPAALLFAAVFLLLEFAIGWKPALLVGASVTVILLLAEVALAVLVVGRWFDRFDVAENQSA